MSNFHNRDKLISELKTIVHKLKQEEGVSVSVAGYLYTDENSVLTITIYVDGRAV